MEVDGLGYAPCVTSAQELSASGWTRAHEVVSTREAAAGLYQDQVGLWINPHAPGGGVGVPWADLRRLAVGLDAQPPGPLRISEPVIELPQFYALLAQNAHRTPRSARCAAPGSSPPSACRTWPSASTSTTRAPRPWSRCGR
ncbi:hypothetical protein ACFQVA_30655 [Actinomadura keratinilytica]